MDNKFQIIKIENIFSWLKSSYYLIFKPSIFIKETKGKNNFDVLLQLVFYFLIYTSFFILISNDFHKEFLLKRSTLTIILDSFSLISILLISFFLFEKKTFRAIFIFLISFKIITSTILILLKFLFYTTEDYFFELLSNIFYSIIFLYTNYIVIIFFTKKWTKVLSYLLLNYLLINFVAFFSIFYKIDNNAPIVYDDPIYSEYLNGFNNLKSKNDIPIQKSYLNFKDSVYFNFIFIDIIKDTINGSTDEIKINLFKKNLNDNLILLEKLDCVFNRNKIIFHKYNEYFNQIQQLIKQEYFFPMDLRDKGYKLHIIGIPVDTILYYTKNIDYNTNLITRQTLVDYHNEYMKSRNISFIPLNIINKFQFISLEFLINRFFQKKEIEILKVTDFLSTE